MRRPASAVLFLLIFAVPTIDAIVAAQAPASSYDGMLDAYRAGKVAAAVGDFLRDRGRGRRDAEAALDDALKRPEAATRARVASMLHTDLAITLWPVARRDAQEHLRLARRWIDLLTPADSAFRRRWYFGATLFIVERFTAEPDFEPALWFLQDALEAVPDEVPLLTLAGWLHERRALEPAEWHLRNDPQAVEPRRRKSAELSKAAEYLERAQRLDPSAPEVLLRLARVCMLRGEHDAARALVAQVIAANDVPPALLSLAHSLLGRLHEERGDANAARRLSQRGGAHAARAAPARRAGARRCGGC